MSQRIVDFFDGNESSTEPVVGNIVASDLVQYPDDASFEADNMGSPQTGNIYYNTTDNKIRYYNGSAWVSIADYDDIAGFANTSLSNLTTTSINQNLNPNVDATRNIGNSGSNWNNVNAKSLQSSTGLNVRTQDTSTGVNGGNIQITAASNDDDSNGGSILVNAGHGGPNADTNGGDYSIASGNGENNGSAGGVVIQGGIANGVGQSGTISISGGNGSVAGSTPGNVNSVAGSANGGNQNGGGVVFLSGDGDGSGSGGTSEMVGGVGGATGDGGTATLGGGSGGATSGTGGLAQVVGGDATGGDSTGGQANVRAGNGFNDGIGGDASLRAGHGGSNNGDGGSVQIRGGNANGTGGGGSVDSRGGNGGTGGAGGSHTVRGGNAGSGSNSVGGEANVFGGNGDGSGSGGNVNLTPGTGGDAGKIFANGEVVIQSFASDPTSPQDGSVWYNSTDNKFKFRENGVTQEYITAAASQASYAYLSEQQTSGTNGGTFTAGAYVTRVLNTEVDPDGIVTLSSNQFTLTAGTYIIRASAPATGVDTNGISFHKAKLRNITDSSDTIIGTAENIHFDSASGSFGQTRAFVNGMFTIAGTKTFEIQHRCTETENTFGLGAACSFGDAEIYTTVEIVKLP